MERRYSSSEYTGDDDDDDDIKGRGYYLGVVA